jgi:hypothetical protein
VRVPCVQPGVRHLDRVASSQGASIETPVARVLSGLSGVRVLAMWRHRTSTLEGARPGGRDGTWCALDPTPMGGTC